jgi:hypothetical protein
MQRIVIAAALGTALACAGCAHLVQPRTWTTDHHTVELQRREYLEKELVRGLPEETFRRWYTRAAGWEDPLRPAIQETRVEDGATIYEVGTGAGSAGEVAFRDGVLDHWSRWRLVQESVMSTWLRETVEPRAVDAATLARIATLDPISDALRPGDLPDPSKVCDYDAGDTVETLSPLVYDREHDNRIELFVPRERVAKEGARYGTLPTGTRLRIERWEPVHGRRLRGDDGTRYLVDTPMGLDALRGMLCPDGACVAPGADATTTRDLTLAISGDAGDPSLAIIEGLARIPVWMARGGTLPAGTRATVRRWNACGAMQAEIELASPDPGIPRVLNVPVAPPGLFVAAPAAPAPSAPGSGGARAGSGRERDLGRVMPAVPAEGSGR